MFYFSLNLLVIYVLIYDEDFEEKNGIVKEGTRDEVCSVNN